jgi:DNA-binding NtrC family response regulator
MMRLANILFGNSSAMVALREQVTRLLESRCDEPVLIQGEHGTGKSTLARVMHRLSARVAGPFVHCDFTPLPIELIEAELFGAVPGCFCDGKGRRGLFQHAHGGTIYLVEIDLIPLPVQSKLLKVLTDKRVSRVGSTQAEAADVWLIAAASHNRQLNQDLRPDLYERLAHVTLRMPPLRERGTDVLLFADRFLRRACTDSGLAPKTFAEDAKSALLAYLWPGNLRELAKVVERATLLSKTETITASLLAPLLPLDPRIGSARRGTRSSGRRGRR